MVEKNQRSDCLEQGDVPKRKRGSVRLGIIITRVYNIVNID